MSKYAQGKFQLLHPEKYVGNKSPTYRSSWEFSVMTMCDNNPSILQWASEAIHINYKNPFTGKNTIYVPDFFMVYIDAKGKQHAEVIEVKPLKETTLEAAGKSKKAQAAANPPIKEGTAAQDFELFKKLVTAAAQAQPEVATGQGQGAEHLCHIWGTLILFGKSREIELSTAFKLHDVEQGVIVG